MFIGRNMLRISGCLMLAAFVAGMSVGGCETAEAPPAVPKMPGCNAGGFVLILEPGHQCSEVVDVLNAKYASDPPDPDAPDAPDKKPPWTCEAVCGGGPDLPKPLQRFASLTWNLVDGTPSGIADAKEILNQPQMKGIIKSVEEDCLVTAPMADSLTQTAGPELYKAFRDAAGVNSELESLQNVPETRPFVAVLDTLPPGKDPTGSGVGADEFPFGKNEHGWTVLSIIRDLTSFLVNPPEPEPILALPNIDYDNIDMEDGGNFGRLFHLANAICKATDNWESWAIGEGGTLSVPPPVLVLALGALPLEGQQCNSEEAILEESSLATQVVYYAMQHAACHGAAIVAAAGNDPNGSITTPGCLEVPGATCPGAMSQISAPTPALCQQLYNEESSYHAANYKIYDPEIHADPVPNPLVHMISGVEADGTLLSTTRLGGRSKLAAIGRQGIAQDIDGIWHTAWTGTSISTAVAAAAFATLFAYKSDLTAAEAADILYASAFETPFELNQRADDGSGAPVKMISICRALEVALGASVNLGCNPPAENVNRTIPLKGFQEGNGLTGFDEDIEAIPSSTDCGGNSPMLSPAPYSTKCPDCGYLANWGRAVINLAKGDEISFSRLTLILHLENGKSKPCTLRNFGFAPGSRLELDLRSCAATLSPPEIRSVTFEALAEADGYSSVVSGEIPIFNAVQ